MEKLENDFGCWISSSSVANLQWDASGFHWFRFWALWIIGVTWNSIIFGQLHCKFFLFILVPFSDTLFMRFFNLLISLYEVFTFISSAFEYWKFVSFYLTLSFPASNIIEVHVPKVQTLKGPQTNAQILQSLFNIKVKTYMCPKKVASIHKSNERSIHKYYSYLTIIL